MRRQRGESGRRARPAGWLSNTRSLHKQKADKPPKKIAMLMNGSVLTSQHATYNSYLPDGLTRHQMGTVTARLFLASMTNTRLQQDFVTHPLRLLSVRIHPHLGVIFLAGTPGSRWPLRAHTAHSVSIFLDRVTYSSHHPKEMNCGRDPRGPLSSVRG